MISLLYFVFLADSTSGHTYVTVLRPSSMTLCILAKRCVLEPPPTPQTPFDHIWAVVRSGARGNIAI